MKSVIKKTSLKMEITAAFDRQECYQVVVNGPRLINLLLKSSCLLSQQRTIRQTYTTIHLPVLLLTVYWSFILI